MSTESMKSRALLKTLIQFLALTLILLIGSIATSAEASEPTICIQRTAAEECKRKVLAFDDLADQASLVRRQRDEAVGAREELRYLYTLEREALLDWQKKAEAAQAIADAAPSRLVWFGAGAAAGITTTVLVFVLVR